MLISLTYATIWPSSWCLDNLCCISSTLILALTISATKVGTHLAKHNVSPKLILILTLNNSNSDNYRDIFNFCLKSTFYSLSNPIRDKPVTSCKSLKVSAILLLTSHFVKARKRFTLNCSFVYLYVTLSPSLLIILGLFMFRSNYFRICWRRAFFWGFLWRNHYRHSETRLTLFYSASGILQ